jgi:hypothetical protein
MARRITAAIVVCGLALLLWILNGRSVSLVLDRLHTVPIKSQEIQQVDLRDVDVGTLRLNDLPFGTIAPDNQRYPVEMKVDGTGNFLVQCRDRTIVLGRTVGSLGAVLKPATNDSARLQINRGLITWPTPFEMNFMTGQSPSWRRHLYYRFLWKKPDGRQLLMTWRYEQPFFQGWAGGFITHEGTTGLIAVDIQP